MKKIKYLLFTLALLGTAGWGPLDLFSLNIFRPRMPDIQSTEWMSKEMSAIHSQADNIDPAVLKLSLHAYVVARQHGYGSNKQLLTIIDYSKSSNERRLWVVDLKYGRVLFNTWVSHGKNSGKVYATSFSNNPGSLKSSIGVFLTTQEPYVGGNGYSLRLQGLEQGINDNAFKRDIVVHGAWYANPGIIKKYGEIGRSWGCPAVSLETVKPLINTIKDNTLVVAYYPDRHWLHYSAFLAS